MRDTHVYVAPSRAPRIFTVETNPVQDDSGERCPVQKYHEGIRSANSRNNLRRSDDTVLKYTPLHELQEVKTVLDPNFSTYKATLGP